MPRSGWLAVGAVGAAVALGSAADGGRSAAALALAGLAAVVGGVIARAARVEGLGRAGIGVGVGALVIAGRLLLAPAATPPTWHGPLPTGSGPWTAMVQSVGPPRAAQRPALLALVDPSGLRVAASLPAYPVVVPGDRVRVEGSLRAPPDGPYGTYLGRLGVPATLRSSSLVVEPPASGRMGSVEGMRRGADGALAFAIPEPEAGLASGILIGLRDRVDRDLSAAFMAVGATHVVAISGWNIAIVAATLSAAAGRASRRRRSTLIALAIVAYVLFVGPSASVVRAAAMAGVVMLAREAGRPSSAPAAIGWAVTILLAVDPAMAGDVGFQLSTLATAGIVVWGTPFADRLSGSAPGRLRAWLAEALGVSLAAQVATLPIVLFTFGRLSIVSPLVNLGVVPLVAPAMGAGLVALVGGFAGLAGVPVAATLLGLPAWALLSLMVTIVRAGASVPFASILLEPPWDGVAAGVSGIAIAAIAVVRQQRGAGARRRPVEHATLAAPPRQGGTAARGWTSRRGPRLLAVGLAASVGGLALVAVHRPDEIARVIVLDVGQGDAVLVEGGRGGRLLVDGGPDPGRLLIALDERLPPWDRRIDIIVLTHPHEDHAAGLAALIDRYAVGRVLEPGMIGPGPGYAALESSLEAAGTRAGRLVTGDRLSIDDIRLRVLWPDTGGVPERPADGGTAINNVSIVLLGEVAGHRFLLAGDIEEQIDPTLLARGLPTVDLLKVAHHGSRTSSTAAMLGALRPGVAVVSAGLGNPYGHPNPGTLQRLVDSGAEIHRTDLDGTVTVEIGPGPLRVRESGGRAAAASAGPPAAPRTSVALLCGLPASAATAALASDQAPLQRPVPRLRFGPPSAAHVPAPDPSLRYASPRARPPETRAGRVLLGRRRVRARHGRRGVSRRRGPIPGRRTGALASRNGRHRPGPGPRRTGSAARHGDDVRGGHAGDRRRCGRARAERRRPRRVRGGTAIDRRG